MDSTGSDVSSKASRKDDMMKVRCFYSQQESKYIYFQCMQNLTKCEENLR